MKTSLRLILFFCVLAVPSSGWAAGPILEPSTNSYFELRDNVESMTWKNARRQAKRLTYKGRRGRLAVVSSPSVHAFLAKNFSNRSEIWKSRPREEIWIGLRYWCGQGALQWDSGDRFNRSGFKAWHRRWYRLRETACFGNRTFATGDKFMPVYYTHPNNGFLWQASGPGKGFRYYFVEYPSPEE